jgi:hypothetical protein
MVTKKIKHAVAFALIGLSHSVFAGGAATGGATEVTQLLNHVEMSMQTVKQQAEYALQMEQYYTQIKQLVPSELEGFIMSANELNNVINELSEIRSVHEDAFGALDQLKSLADQRFTDYTRSGLPWEEYVDRERNRSLEEHGKLQALREHEIHAMKRVEKSFEEIKKHGDDAKVSQGMHDALQVLNGQMNSLLSMMNEMRAHDVAAGQYQTEYYAKKIEEETWKTEELNLARERAKIGDEQTQMIIEHLRGNAGI